MNNIVKFIVSGGLIILLQSCTVTKQKSYSGYKSLYLNTLLESNIYSVGKQLEIGGKRLRKNVKNENSSKKSLNRLARYEYLKNKLVSVTKVCITKHVLDFMKGKTIKEYIKHIEIKKDFSQSYIYILKKNTVHELIENLNEYSAFLKKNYTPYLKDTTSWSKRYIKVLPQANQKNPTDFTTFYFRATSPEEAIVILNTLQLGILQEALEIQRKILKE
ncbi:hypothetical protein [Microscilla marina]|nr:hypothetical protein [Microscilla marina]